MTIPTRDELIARWCAYHTASVEDGKDRRGMDEIAADFALAELRRALVAELEALRRRLGAVTLQDDYTRAAMAAVLDARLAALRSEQNEPQTAPPTTEGSQRGVAPHGSGLGGAPSREANLLSPNPSGGRQHASSGLAATFDKAGASERERLRDESPAGNVAAPALSDSEADARFKTKETT